MSRVHMAGQTDREWPSNVILLARAAMPPRMQTAVNGDILELIRSLRVLLRQSRLRPRTDFDHACSLIAVDSDSTAERYAAAFFQGLQLFALRQLCFFTVRANTASDDEMWLARLLLTLKSGDFTSAKYLMALRIAGKGHRRLLFLAEKLAQILCPPEIEQAWPSTGVQSANQ
jgi:hypothetical protein